MEKITKASKSTKSSKSKKSSKSTSSSKEMDSPVGKPTTGNGKPVKKAEAPKVVKK